MEIHGGMAHLEMTTSTAGMRPDVIEDQTQSFSVQVDGKPSYITATLLSTLPKGLELKLFLKAPENAQSKEVLFQKANEEKVVVWGIPKGEFKNLSIVYRLSMETTASLIKQMPIQISFKLKS